MTPEDTINKSVVAKKALLSKVLCGKIVAVCPIDVTTALHLISITCPERKD
jgi:hypothetical protein